MATSCGARSCCAGGASVVHRSLARRAFRWHEIFYDLWARDEQQLELRRQALDGALHKRPVEVFPLRFAVEDGLLTEAVAGERRGFQVWSRAAPHVCELP